jgi:hypothetical protein
LNHACLQSELDAARKSHKEALEAASAAEKKALLLEVRQCSARAL